jgi:hypothetical protein
MCLTIGVLYRLLLEEKLSPQGTDEVLPGNGHTLIRRFAPPSPEGEGFFITRFLPHF